MKHGIYTIVITAMLIAYCTAQPQCDYYDQQLNEALCLGEAGCCFALIDIEDEYGYRYLEGDNTMCWDGYWFSCDEFLSEIESYESDIPDGFKYIFECTCSNRNVQDQPSPDNPPPVDGNPPPNDGTQTPPNDGTQTPPNDGTQTPPNDGRQPPSNDDSPQPQPADQGSPGGKSQGGQNGDAASGGAATIGTEGDQNQEQQRQVYCNEFKLQNNKDMCLEGEGCCFKQYNVKQEGSETDNTNTTTRGLQTQERFKYGRDITGCFNSTDSTKTCETQEIAAEQLHVNEGEVLIWECTCRGYQLFMASFMAFLLLLLLN